MKKLFLLLVSLPKIIYTNFKYLPLSQAIHLPIVITHGAIIKGNGKIRFVDTKLTAGMARIGFRKVSNCNPTDKSVLQIDGKLILKGGLHIARGANAVLRSLLHVF